MRQPCLAAILLACTAAPAAESTVDIDPARTAIEFVLDATAHQVRGSFALRRGTIRFDPATGAASGEIVVDLASARTGNARRDDTMHRTVLETPAHPEAVFRPRSVRGALAPAGVSSISLEGVLAFHGQDRPFTIPARVTRTGDRLVAEAAFDIPYVAWGLTDPSFLVLRVAKSVRVTVRAEGSLVAP